VSATSVLVAIAVPQQNMSVFLPATGAAGVACGFGAACSVVFSTGFACSFFFLPNRAIFFSFQILNLNV
jgi:hypothetical protein